jgi:putative ABC transport system ATP-binding protein
VSQDTRLNIVADRILWLEDGAFRDLQTMTTDPICGMSVDPQGAPHLQVDGEIVYFCSTACRNEYAGSGAAGRHGAIRRQARPDGR